MAHEEKNKALDLTQIKPLDVPHYSVSSMTAQGTGNDFVLTLSRPVPVQSITTGQMNATNVINQPVVILTISPQTAKDMTLALSEAVAKHEKEYGKLETRYSRSIEASAKPAAKAH